MYNAMRRNNVDEVTRLLQSGYPVNHAFSLKDGEPLIYQDTPIMTASKWGNINLVRVLLSYGAHVNAVNCGTGMSALHQACGNGHYDIARLLISQGARVNHADYIYETPLLEAINCKNIDLVKLLVYNGAEFSRPVNSAYDNSALFALSIKQMKIVRFLIAAGTNVNYKNNFGEDILSVLQDTSRDINYLMNMYEFFLDAGCKVTLRHLNQIRLRQIRNRLANAFIEPQSLQKQCRRTLRIHISQINNGLCIIERVHHLPLPKSIIMFLSYDVDYETHYKIAR